MKIAPFFATAACCMITMLSGCSKEENAPASDLEAADVKAAVQGKWSVERIDYQLCRNNYCSATRYTGRALDYFEFRADSAFLVRTGDGNQLAREGFKTDFSLNRAFILSNHTWSGRFEVQELKQGRLVLLNSFTGRDPAAVFTDTYYLYR